MVKPPKILAIKELAKSALFCIEQLHLRFSNGVERYFERLKPREHQAVMIVPLLDENTVLLVREYGAGINDYFLGFPKGFVEEGETIYTAANRELMEEVGYGAAEFVDLAAMTLSPAYLGHKMHVLLARQLYPQQLTGDEPEPIEVIPWHLDQIDELLARKDFHEARSIAALFLVKEKIRVG